MAKIHITQYKAMWDLNHHYGMIRLRAENGSWSPAKKFDNPAEYQVLLDLLRNERPIFHDTEQDRIQTTNEPIGEDE